MEYKVLNTKPEVMTVDVDTLKSRIDAHHYRPRFLSAADKVLNIKYSRPSALGQETHKIGQPADIRSYCDSGVPILNAKNVRPLYLNNDECPLVEKGIAEKHKKQTLNGDEVLIVRTGAKCGDVAWVSSAFSNYLVNSHVIPIRPKGNLEPTFLAAYLSSTLGQMLLDREMTGAAQRQVSVASLNSTVVPLPDSKIQRHIGRKVEIAEKCREEAICCESNAEGIFGQHWSATTVTLSGSFTNLTGLDVLSNDRLDPEFYRNDLLSMRDRVLKNKNGHVRIGKYGESFSGKTPSDKGDDDSLCEIVRVANLTSRGLNWSNRLFGTISKSKKGLLKDGDIIVCKDAHQKYYIGQQVDIYCRPNHHAVASSETLVIRFKREHINPFAALIYLRSKEGYAAFQQQIRGTSAHLYPTDVENIVVPKIPEDAEEQIEQLIRRAEHCRIRAYALTDEAKSDVEALIEGKLDTNAILSGKLKAPTWKDIEKELEGI